MPLWISTYFKEDDMKLASVVLSAFLAV